MTTQEAVNKIDSEADKLGEQGQIIAQYIIDNFLSDEQSAELVENKTLEECIKELKNKAQRQAKNGVAMIKDDTVYAWVREFYGFAEKAKSEKVIDLFDFI
mgnify:CR=1 FL=1